MARKKISIIGAGYVGSTCAHWLAQRQIADIVLLDIIDGLAAGKALDLSQACHVMGLDVSIAGTSQYKDTAHSDIVVITSGLPRKAGMSRDELLTANVKIVADVTKNVIQYSPDTIIIMVTNPLDAMTYAAAKISSLPKQRIMGMAGVLDTARYCYFISRALNVSIADVNALLLGGHGDDMVPLPRYTTVNSIPLHELLDWRQIEAIVERTRKGGGEIVSLLKTCSAYFAPSASVTKMIQAILQDKRSLVPCCAWCDREYKANGCYVGVPAILGSNGVEEVIELDLNPQEQNLFNESLQHVRRLAGRVDTLL